MPTKKKQVLFVQGGGRGTHDEWDDKLVASLAKELDPDHVIHYPRMPREEEPDPAAWKRTLGKELGTLGDDAIAVGHSLGAAILLEYLAEGEVEHRLAGVFLIATPYIGEGGWPSGELRPTNEIAARLPAGTLIRLYQGDDDDTVPPAHVGMLAKVLPHATVRRLKGRDHQLNDDLSEVARDISAGSR
jgi:predicted alpha/beta hydrolase family esterase